MDEKELEREKKLNHQLSSDGLQADNDNQKSSEKLSKQKRGRPAGSKNKSKSNNEGEDDEQDEEERGNSQGLTQKKPKVDCKEVLKKESSRTDWPTD